MQPMHDSRLEILPHVCKATKTGRGEGTHYIGLFTLVSQYFYKNHIGIAFLTALLHKVTENVVTDRQTRTETDRHRPSTVTLAVHVHQWLINPRRMRSEGYSS